MINVYYDIQQQCQFVKTLKKYFNLYELTTIKDKRQDIHLTYSEICIHEPGNAFKHLFYIYRVLEFMVNLHVYWYETINILHAIR